MAKWKKAAHVVYQCSYHLVWTPKYRYRILQGEIKEYVEKKIRAICEWKNVDNMKAPEDSISWIRRSLRHTTYLTGGQK